VHSAVWRLQARSTLKKKRNKKVSNEENPSPHRFPAIYHPIKRASRRQGPPRLLHTPRPPDFSRLDRLQQQRRRRRSPNPARTAERWDALCSRGRAGAEVSRPDRIEREAGGATARSHSLAPPRLLLRFTSSP